tara:strand:- start:3350 stop:3673 length:324 start_codon:yes stop_codon:yes gene_type:complete
MKVLKKKKIVFDDTDIRHAKLKIRLQHDGITQAEFFRALVTAYIEKDSSVVSYIKNYKLKNKKQSKKHIKQIDEDMNEGQELMEKFGIADGEIEDIFDLIASEHPNL